MIFKPMLPLDGFKSMGSRPMVNQLYANFPADIRQKARYQRVEV